MILRFSTIEFANQRKRSSQVADSTQTKGKGLTGFARILLSLDGFCLASLLSAFLQSFHVAFSGSDTEVTHISAEIREKHNQDEPVKLQPQGTPRSA